MARGEPARTWLCDLDGVLVNDGSAIDGASRFIGRLAATDRSLIVLTNNSMFSAEEQSSRLSALGIDVDPELIWTSALATAKFVATQRPGATVFAIGEACLREALEREGCRLVGADPEYVVVGETQRYSFDEMTQATRAVAAGAHLVATNPEPTGPSPEGPLPACGAIVALIERASGATAYVVGKPNPLMIAEALGRLNASRSDSVIVGDRLETDIMAGVGLGLESILVLSGAATIDDVARFPFSPTRIVASVAELADEL